MNEAIKKQTIARNFKNNLNMYDNQDSKGLKIDNSQKPQFENLEQFLQKK